MIMGDFGMHTIKIVPKSPDPAGAILAGQICVRGRLKAVLLKYEAVLMNDILP